jgi:hypothetical protein
MKRLLSFTARERNVDMNAIFRADLGFLDHIRAHWPHDVGWYFRSDPLSSFSN